ncbi:MAG: Uncharacterized protein G01um101419_230 [Parcubacteria group bacterium Gr01-1014_19]|nr:MAG: Uncharacterized protein G01um101419_230 [Parcubacteria group bacterium Gr01-1014_19]
MNETPKTYEELRAKYEFLSGVDSFDCGLGWLPLISDLCAKLKALHLDQIRVTRVKEKFGELRFYVDSVPKNELEVFEKVLLDAIKRSAETCERCGQPGRTTTINKGMRIITLCEECKKKAK